MSRINEEVLREVTRLVVGQFPPLAAIFDLLERREDSIWKDRVEKQLEELRRAVGHAPELLWERVCGLLAEPGGSDVRLRHAKSCLIVARELSLRSREGRSWDPELSCEQALTLLSREFEQPENELELVVHELERTGLVSRAEDPNSPLGWSEIGPTDDFFWRTDALFHPWTPEEDAREICRRTASLTERSFAVGPVAAGLGWSARRMNAALGFMVSHDLVDDDDREVYAGLAFVFPWARLTPEGRFFVERA